MQFLRLLPVGPQVILGPGIVPVKFRGGDLLVKGLPIGVVQRQLNTELLDRGGHVEPGPVEIVGPLPFPAFLVSLVHAAVQALHGLPALKLLLFHVEPGDGVRHGVHPGGNVAGGALQRTAAAFKQGAAILGNAEGLQFLALKDPAAVLLHAEQAVGLIQKHGAAPKADVEAVSGGKLGLQGLIVLKIDEILLEVRQGHLVHGPGGQIDLAVALLADGLAVDLCGQQPGRRIAANRAELLIVAE